jgi:hypothetical protein
MPQYSGVLTETVWTLLGILSTGRWVLYRRLPLWDLAMEAPSLCTTCGVPNAQVCVTCRSAEYCDLISYGRV